MGSDAGCLPCSAVSKSSRTKYRPCASIQGGSAAAPGGASTMPGVTPWMRGLGVARRGRYVVFAGTARKTFS
jgi:hypothetical protein